MSATSSAGAAGGAPATLIRGASWIVAWDEGQNRHVYRCDGDVAFAGGRLLQAGGRFAGEALEVIDGRGRMVMPGLVNVHAHSADEAMSKGLFEDVGTPALHGNQLYTYSQLLEDDPEALAPCTRVTLGGLLLSGVTTVVDLSVPYEGWIGELAQSGMRVVAGPLFREARWRAQGWHRLDYEWDEAAGRRSFERALAVLDEVAADPSGRLSGILAPSQADTCSPGLLREVRDEARRRGLKVTLHAAQTMSELDEMLRRHGLGTVAWLEREGLLTPDLILGHGIYLDHHPRLRLRTAEDLGRLAAHGTGVAHCPVTFARTGMTLDSLGRYLRAGVRVGIGTDTWPYDMLEELRQAILCARITTGDVFDVSTGEAFHAATAGGADLLGRLDLGRLAPGACADLVLVDLEDPAMRPLHDPLRSLVHAACGRAVRDVFVAGRRVVREGRLATIDLPAAAAALEAAQRRAIARIPGRDPWRRGLEEIAPRALPMG
ncbi:amidohydrolase family protein [Geminicoccaceae bacterium 1502E]|nr:amidohydrolase family protein [Geminicoccaceae bacterium 1502E]